MDFSCVEDIYKDLDKDMYTSAIELGKKIKEDYKKYIKTEIYDKYSPNVYNRQMSLYNSIDFVVIKRDLCNYEIVINVKDDIHKYNPTWKDEENKYKLKNVTYSEILDRFANEDSIKLKRGEPVDVHMLTEEEWIDNKKAEIEIIKYLEKWF